MTKKAQAQYSIVRTYSAGVFAGIVVSRNGDEVVMDECRRLWYWDGAASLSDLAVNGVSRPENCKFPPETKGHLVKGVIEIIPMTAKAISSVKAVKEWTKH